MVGRGCYARNAKKYIVTRSFIVSDVVSVEASSTEIARDIAAEIPRPDCILKIPVTYRQQKWRAKRLPAAR